MAVTNEYRLTGEWKNSVDYKPVVYDFAEDLMIFAFAYPALALYGIQLDPGPGAFLRPLVPLAALLLMTAVRRRAKKAYAFAGGLIAIVAAVALLPFHAPTRTLFLLLTLAAGGVSVKKVHDSVKRAQLKYDQTIRVSGGIFVGFGLFALGIFVLYLTYMVSIGLQKPLLLPLCIGALAVFLALLAVYLHRTGTYCLNAWKEDKNYRFRKIGSFNLLFGLLSTAAVAITAFFSYNIVYWTGLYRLDDSLIAKILHMPKVQKAAQSGQDSGSGSNSTSYYMNFMKNHHYKPTLLTEILNKVLIVLGWVLICVCLLIVAWLLIRAIFGFIRRLRGGINEETRTVFSLREAAGEAAVKLRRSSVVNFFSGNSNRIRIRRLYYRAVRGYRVRGVAVAASDSPAEIGEKIRSKAGRDLAAATSLYEKARYDREDCSREDLARFKEDLRNNRR